MCLCLCREGGGGDINVLFPVADPAADVSGLTVVGLRAAGLGAIRRKDGNRKICLVPEVGLAGEGI